MTYPSTVNRTFLYFKHKQRPFTNQVEFSGPIRLGVNHDLLVGWDHQTYRRRTTRVDSASTATTPIDLYNPVETHVTRTDFPPTRYDYQDNFTNAGYFQDNMTISSKVKAVVGARMDGIRRFTHNNPIVVGVETEVPVVRRRSVGTTSRVGLVYQPVSQVDLYTQYATSFLPNFNLQLDGSTLEPEYGVQYEAGQRFRLMKNRLQLNTSVFEITKRNVTFSRPAASSSKSARCDRAASRPTSTLASRPSSASTSDTGIPTRCTSTTGRRPRPTSRATSGRGFRRTR